MSGFPKSLPDISGEKLHVLVVSNHLGIKKSLTGAGVFIDRQIASLRAAGIRVSNFDIGSSYTPARLFKRMRELRRIAHKLGVDLVHARYGTIIAALSVLSEYPTVITYGGSDLLPGASVSLIRTYAGIFLSNLASLFAKGIICVSEELRQSLWWRKNSAVVIPDGIDINLFVPGSQDEARRSLGWGLGHPIAIINAARDPQNKGLPLAQEAMEMAITLVPDAELRIIQGVDPNDMPLCYQAADVLICASRQEGSPNVVKEALACNLPVVSTFVGDVPERLGGVFPSALVPRDSKAMGKALADILVERTRSNGRLNILNLGMEETAQKVISVYKAALGRVAEENQ